MESSLQKWCVEASTQAIFRLTGPDQSNRPLHSGVEQAIDTAAFLKLMQTRGIEVGHPSFKWTASEMKCDDLLFELAETCPLTESSPVEVLGAIHEFLVSLRTRSSSVRDHDLAGRSRKANGVFYTPCNVINYIIEQTLGKRLESSTPTQAKTLSILDPAAGCGAFLVIAFRFLLNWHLEWYEAHQPEQWPDDIERRGQRWTLTFKRRMSILFNHLFGVDLDPDAVTVTRRMLMFELLESSAGCVDRQMTAMLWKRMESNFRTGHALIGPAFKAPSSDAEISIGHDGFRWTQEFPQIAARGGFDVVIGNPPYRRERDFKRELDLIGMTPLGSHRAPRMDLWYYFVHRGIELLNDTGSLSFVTSAYWLQSKGAEKLIAALRDQVHLDELFLLRDAPIFPGVTGQHVIFRATKASAVESTRVKFLSQYQDLSGAEQNQPLSNAVARSFAKSHQELFLNGLIDVSPPAHKFLEKIETLPRLIELGIVRQGIAENPSTINRRTIERFQNDASSSTWTIGEGVFSLAIDELEKLNLTPDELAVMRPYHDLCDLGRYRCARNPSRRLIYSTRDTCPDIADYPNLQRHLSRFQMILNARRETRDGSNRWWHLHWPRDERIWKSSKLIVLQMASRPSFVPAFNSVYVPFSANVFVPGQGTREDLRYLSALLNSRVLWNWFEHRAKRRGVGLELNGHVLQQAPILRIDFGNADDVRRHDELVALVDQRMQIEQSRERLHATGRSAELQVQSIENRIDAAVEGLYQVDAEDVRDFDSN